jgi:hypothetical protein
MIITALLARQYSIGVESIRWALLDRRGEFSAASPWTESVDDEPVSEAGSLTSYSRIYFTGSNAWPLTLTM